MIKQRLSIQLFEVLKDELDVFKELLNLGNKKTDVLIEGDVELLKEIISLEQDIILNLGKLEKEREQLINALGEKMGQQSEDITARMILKLLPQEKQKSYEAKYVEIKKILEELDEVNKLNENLIKSALDYIELSIDLLTDASKTSTSYSADGNTNEKTIHFIDKKA